MAFAFRTMWAAKRTSIGFALDEVLSAFQVVFDN